jgi:predicted nucleic acid-binding protein
MTVLIDSWTWIEYWKGGELAKEAARYIEGDEESVVSVVNIAEIYFWVARYYGEGKAQEKLGTVEKRCHVIAVEKEIAIAAAKIRILNKLALADSLIVATARSTGGKVVSGDSDMKSLEDVIFLKKSDSSSA